MTFYRLIYIVALVGIITLYIGCDQKDKWNTSPLNIKKQSSYNYSEIVSGKLDSTAKVQLENLKNTTKEKIEQAPKMKTKVQNSILESLQNFYNSILELF